MFARKQLTMDWGRRIALALAVVVFIALPLGIFHGSAGASVVEKITKYNESQDPFCMGLGDGCAGGVWEQ